MRSPRLRIVAAKLCAMRRRIFRHSLRAADGRSAGAILAHIGDLLDWALSMASGQPEWHNSKTQTWNEDVDRFHAALTAFDAYLASDQPLHTSAEKLFQGPVADALTHVGTAGHDAAAGGGCDQGRELFRG